MPKRRNTETEIDPNELRTVIDHDVAESSPIELIGHANTDTITRTVGAWALEDSPEVHLDADTQSGTVTGDLLDDKGNRTGERGQVVAFTWRYLP